MLFDGEGATDPRWSPDGTAVLYVMVRDGYSDLVLHRLPYGPDIPLTNNVPPFEPGSEEYVDSSVWVEDPAWSESGSIVFASEAAAADRRMTLWMLVGSSSTPVPAPGVDDAGNIEGVSISANGDLVAYTERELEPGNGPTRVMVRDLNDGSTALLAADAGGVFDPAFSPDASSVVVSVRASNGKTDLWLIDRETGEWQKVTDGAHAISATWSPDGEWLAYLSPDGDNFALWAMRMSGGVPQGSPRRLGTFNGIDASGGLSWTLASDPVVS